MKKEKKQRKPMNKKTKLRLLQAGSVVSLIAPIGITVACNFETFFATGRSAFGLTIGGMLLIAFAVLDAIGKMKEKLNTNKALWVFAIVFVMSILLEPLILNLKLISGMLLLGEGINVLAFTRQISKIKADMSKEEDRKGVADAIKDALKGIEDGGKK